MTYEEKRARHARWVEAYTVGGQGIRTIGAADGVSGSAVWKILKQLGVQRRPPGRPVGPGRRIDDAAAQALLDAGHSKSEVARRQGVTHTAILLAIKCGRLREGVAS